MTIILGVDPGLSGALVFLDPVADTIAAYDMPTTTDTVDAAEVARLIRLYSPSFAVIERVHSMPKQGVASTFSFGQSFGIVRGVVAALNIPIHLITPTVWKRRFGLLSVEKDASRTRAIELWPASDAFRRKKDHGRADAALLARYGYEVLIPR